MIKEKELQELCPPIRYSSGQNITLPDIHFMLDSEAKKFEIPAAFRFEQISGGLFGKKDDCLVIYHPEHEKDYFSVAIRVKYQGTYAFISRDTFGTSKLFKAEAVRKQLNATAKEGINYRGYNIIENAVAGAAIVGAGIAGVRHLVKGKSDKEKMEVEQQWYMIIQDILNTVLS